MPRPPERPEPDLVSPTLHLKRTLQALQSNNAEQYEISKYWRSKISQHRSRFFDRSPVSISTVRKRNKFESFADSLQNKSNCGPGLNGVRSGSPCKPSLDCNYYGHGDRKNKPLLDRFLDDCSHETLVCRSSKGQGQTHEDRESRLGNIVQNVSRLRHSLCKKKQKTSSSKLLKQPPDSDSALIDKERKLQRLVQITSGTLSSEQLLSDVTAQQHSASCSSPKNPARVDDRSNTSLQQQSSTDEELRNTEPIVILSSESDVDSNSGIEGNLIIDLSVKH